MAIKYLDCYGDCRMPIQACQVVKICLDAGWDVKTVDGFGIVEGKVITIGKTINPRLPYTNQSMCCPTTSTCLPLGCQPYTPPCPTDARIATAICVYSLEVEDTQFTVDPSTGSPYFPICSDVVEISPYNCTISKLLTIIEGLTP